MTGRSRKNLWNAPGASGLRLARIAMLLFIWAISATTAQAEVAAVPDKTRHVVVKTPAAAPVSERVETKSVVGAVSGVGPRFIAVESESVGPGGPSSSEVALTVEGASVFNYKELRAGDIVRVDYREITTPDADGEYTVAKRVATQVTIVSRAPEELPATPEDEE